jgi:hypothetical protein
VVPSSSRASERRPSSALSHSVFEVAAVEPFYLDFKLQKDELEGGKEDDNGEKIRRSCGKDEMKGGKRMTTVKR